MTKPLIGITTFHSDSQRGYIYVAITEAYVKAISRAGAVPILIPVGLSDEDHSQILSILDGILFTGGGDIDPALYEGIPHATVHEIDAERDQMEIHLVREAVERRTPFLGICRGLQVVNVALGGSLYTHIQDQHPNALKHDFFPGRPRDYLAHPVKVDEGTTLANILGQPIVQVNSLHHQGIHHLAADLTPTAFAPDGITEAVELPPHRHPFGLAVQWHPEWLPNQAEMRAIFETFVHVAGNGNGTRS
ncbi:MAG TPA: gamma-glutamyl-gamma-aminobutyrate hydrolase family protein [Anaerolineales bacterium]|nr:gamma-glutamyl-gamma-aminobutyrate hydrolase family protein [Anaerolineales bacterium]